VEAAVKALRDGHHGYTPAPGIPALREAVAADIARRGVEVDPERVVVVPGGKVTMFFAILMPSASPARRSSTRTPGSPSTSR
jgi:aspartate aminotransferase